MSNSLTWLKKKTSPFLQFLNDNPNGVSIPILQKFLEENPGIKWSRHIAIENKPIRYLEIGVHSGDNVSQVARSYAIHPDSKLHCVDPWMDYDEYPEYKGAQNAHYNNAITKLAPIMHKCVIHRGFSDDIVPTFEDNYFDMIFVDGNHETEYVYRDGVMSFQKVKSGGYIIFDDYCTPWITTIAGVNKFLSEYMNRIRIVVIPTVLFCQVILQKL